MDIGQNKKNGDAVWCEVTLPNGRRGYALSGFQIYMYRIASVWRNSAEVHEQPDGQSPVIAFFGKNEKLYIRDAKFSKGKLWIKVYNLMGEKAGFIFFDSVKFIDGLGEGLNNYFLAGDTTRVDAVFVDGQIGKKTGISKSVFESDNPFDEESLNILSSLPKRQAVLSNAFVLLKLVAIPLAFLGIIGLFATYGSLLEFLAIAMLGCGILLWYISETYTFDKAPLGNLVEIMFEGLFQKRNVSKIRTVSSNIIKRACIEAEPSDSIPIMFAGASAYQILAETSQEQEAKHYADKAIVIFKHLKHRGLNTPWLHFCLATSLRITKNNAEAIESYKTYLALRPSDVETEALLDNLMKET